MDAAEVIINEIMLADGQCLVVRKLTAEDAPVIIEYMNEIGGESDNLLRGKNEFDLAVEQEIEYIEKNNSDPYIFMIVGVIKGRIISAAQLHGSSRKRIAHNSEVAISVRKEYWRKGVGTALMVLIMMKYLWIYIFLKDKVNISPLFTSPPPILYGDCRTLVA